MEHRRKVLTLILLVTLFLGLGLPQLTTHSGINEWLPAKDPRVKAFNHLLDDLHGVSNLEFVYLELDPAKTDVTNVTSEEAVRAQYDVYRYVKERVPQVRHVYGLPHWIMLVNHANHGNDPAHYRMPDSSAEYQAAWETVNRTNHHTVQLSVSGDGRGAWIGILFDAEPFTDDARQVSQAIRDALGAYREDPDAPGDIWKDQYARPTGLTAGTAKIDEHVRDDVSLLAPLALALIAIALLLAFRSPGASVSALATLAAGIVWIYGLMGWLGIEVTLANVALVPLILGTGIDFTIHVLNRYQAQRDDGADPRDAFQDVGRRVGVPLALATATTVAGLLTTTLSTIPGMVELGLLAALAMVTTWFLSLTLLPALTTTLPTSRVTFHPLRALGHAARGIARHRGTVAVAALAVTAVLAWNTTNAIYLIDMVEGNFPEGDPFLESSQRLQDQIHASSVEWIILEGDVTDPEALEYIRALEREVFESDLVARRANVQSLVSLLGNYETLEGGSAGAAPVIVQDQVTGSTPRDHAPTTREGIESDIREMYRSPAWAPTAKFIVDREMDLTVLLVVPDVESKSYASAQDLWRKLQDVKQDAEPHRPDDVEAHIYGYRTIPYHFVNYAQESLRNIFLTSLLAAGALIYLFTRRWRAVAAVTVPMAVSAVWWYGLLPTAGIYVGVFLIFPMIFITSIGSDYAAHLVWNLHEGEGMEHVFGTVGKAVAFSAATDALAFGVFSFMYLESAKTIMQGAALAILTVGVATLTLIPVLWSWGRDVEEPGPRVETRDVPEPALAETQG